VAWTDDIYDRNSPLSANPGGLAASYMATGGIRVYGFTVYSSNVAAQFVLVFDRSVLPADSAIPLFAIPVAATSQVSAYYGPMGRIFGQGIVLCNSSTATTKTIGAADCFFDVQYDNLPST
jgi:hypothetical protein